MGAVAMVAGSELRRRWRSLAVVLLLVALAGGVTLASIAGARRTSSSFDRLLTTTRSQDVLVLGHGIESDDVERIRALPEVETVGVGRILALAGPDGELLGGGAVFAALDGVLGRDIYRVRTIAGRPPAEGAADEIAISEALARNSGLRVGDPLPVGSYTQEQLERLREGLEAGEPAGPEIDLRVVGISRSADDLNVQSSSGGVLVLPKAFADEYGDDIGGWYGQGIGLVAIRLDPGAGVGDFVERLDDVLEPGTFDVDPVALTRAGVQESIDLLAMGALMAGAVVGTAGLIAVALAVTAQIVVMAGAQLPLIGMGLERRERMAAVALPMLVVTWLGALLATAAAWSVSGVFPLGVARDAEPHPGPAFDALVLPLGAAAICVLVTCVVLVAASRSVRATTSDASPVLQPSRLTRSLETLGLAPAATVGVRMGLERGQGRTSAPVRAALGGAALAVFGIAGVAVFGASLDRVLATPTAQGRNWDAAVVDTTAAAVDDERRCGGGADTQLFELAAFEAVAVACSGQIAIAGWATGVVGVTPLRGSMQPTVLAGRAPTAPDEVALGSHTLAVLGLDLGDVATVPTPGGPVDYRIVGRVIVPRVVDPQAIADGAVVTGAGFDRLGFGPTDPNWDIVVRVAAELDKEAELARINDLPGVGGDFGQGVVEIDVPLEVQRLGAVSRVPDALAGLLAVLGALAVGYLLVSSVRRRRRDLAVLKAVGFSRRQLMATVACQAATVAIFGIIVGAVPGVAAGGALWRATADDVGVVGTVSVPLLMLAAVALASIVVANLVAAVPARRAANVPAAAILHTE